MVFDPNDRFDEIGELIKEIPGPEWGIPEMGDAVPGWAVQAARKVSVAAGAQPIRYLTGTTFNPPGFDEAGQPRPARPGRLIVFTDTLVAVCTITNVTGQLDTVATQVDVVGRRQLTMITMGNERINRLPADAWPSEQDVLLRYAGIPEPVELLPRPDGYKDIHARQLRAVRKFFASLVDDLASATTVEVSA